MTGVDSRYKNGAPVERLFVDLAVGFTPLSASHSAAEVLGILSELFDQFDEIATQFGAHKVKTIGDAYVACCGAFDDEATPQEAATLAVRFALAMQAYAQLLAPVIRIAPDGYAVIRHTVR